MRWPSLSWLRRPSAAPRATPRRRFRPRLEPLEERTLLNSRFVVPGGVSVDNVSTFATLQAALTTPGLASGDTIQIEPGSSPGNVVNADFTTAFGGGVTGLAIQGDPAAGLSAVPQFTISDAATIAAADTLHLVGVNVGLVAAGSLTFSGNDTIARSGIVDSNSTAPTPITFAGATDILVNSTVVNAIGVGNAVLEVQTPAAGSSNLISGDTFVSNATANAQLAYFSGSAAAVTDRVVDNTFTASASVNFLLVVQESVTGLTIQGNAFRGNAGIGILQTGSTPQGLLLLGNTIELTGTTPIGIAINGGGSGTTTSALISGNVLNAGSTGTGLVTTVGAGTLNGIVQGNDLHNNKIGVEVTGTGSASGIDLGGGPLGSLGGNNFRSFTAAGSATAGAIVTQSGTTGTVFARRNLFSVAAPSTVTFAGGAAIDTSIDATDLTGNAAFVEALYIDFLKRPGDTSNPNDAGAWVNALNAGTLSRAQVANGIIRSPEALGLLVDGLYEKILGRSADPSGRAGLVNFLANGGTIEQAVIFLVVSPEYKALTGSDGAFIQSLYNRLLGRTGSNSEVAGWLGALPVLGRAGVAAAFVSSGEFRGEAVEELYGTPLAAPASVASVLPNLLHRTSAPSASEVSAWVNSGLDLLRVEASIATSSESFTNG
jgi:hypothetical protein